MPDTPDFWQAQEQDMQLFLHANTRFVAESYKQLMKDHTDPEKLLIGLKRLQYIEINDMELQFAIKDQIDQLNVYLGKPISLHTDPLQLEIAPPKTRRQDFIERSSAYKKGHQNSATIEPLLKAELERIVTDIYHMRAAYKSLEGILKGKHRDDLNVLIAKVEDIMASTDSSEEKLLHITELLKEDYKKTKSEYTPSFLNKNRSFLADVNLTKNSHHYSRMLGLILADVFAIPELPEKLKHKDLNITIEVSHIEPSNKEEYSKFSFMSSPIADNDRENLQPH